MTNGMNDEARMTSDEEPRPTPSVIRHSSFAIRHLPFVETALILAVFVIQGAVPAPDVNEPYYLGKAIHYWNPQWAPGDFFLESSDTHHVFCFAFGWLSLWLAPLELAWTGRVLTWGLLAWAWRRLSVAVVPRPWYAILTAVGLVGLVERCQMAGEWVVGGVEAKGFAFVLVFLGLEAMVRGRWNRTWVLLGAAAGLHVLVGGWSVAAAAVAWAILRHQPSPAAPPLRAMWPALAAGFLLSLPGLIPSLTLNWGVEPEVVRQANQIYVYQRLHHHLDPFQFPPEFILRFTLLVVFWGVLCRLAPADEPLRRLRALVVGTLAIAFAGTAAAMLEYVDPAMAAGLLRFYWFRLADVVVPLGFALLAARLVAWALDRRPATGRLLAGAAIALAAYHVGGHVAERLDPAPPPAANSETYGSWRLACAWVAANERIPPTARFLTPLMSQTFKWYTGRSEVVNWKEIPQDARAIVEWWRRLEEIHGTGRADPLDQWYDTMARLRDDPQKTAERLKQLSQKYGADYVLTTRTPRLPLELVYENWTYSIYRMAPPEAPKNKD